MTSAGLFVPFGSAKDAIDIIESEACLTWSGHPESRRYF
jgi:hypothetical protein